MNKIKIHQYTRAELSKITIKKFCERHNVKSINEYQEKNDIKVKELGWYE